MGSSAAGDKQQSMIRILHHAILQVCNEHVGYSHKLQLHGLLCMNIDDQPNDLVIKVNNTLKRVPSNNPTGSGAAGRDILPGGAVPHSLNPAHGHNFNSIAGTQNKTGSLGPAGQLQLPPSVSASQVASPAFIVSPSGLIAPTQAYYNSINMATTNATTAAAALDLHQNVINNNNYNKENIAANAQNFTANNNTSSHHVNATQSSPKLGASLVTTPLLTPRKSKGRKGRKPVRVDAECVYDEGGAMNDDDSDVLTVIPTDPDAVEMEEVSSSPRKDMSTNQRAASRATPSPAHATPPSQHSIMRQVLEQGAAAAMGAINGGESTNGDTSGCYKPSAMTSSYGSNNGSASIRALLQAQAHMRQQAKMAQISPSSSKHDSANQSRSSTPHSTTEPILVTPQSPPIEGVTNSTDANGDESNVSVMPEQEEALDFSNADKEKICVKKTGDEFYKKCGEVVKDTDDESGDEGIEILRAVDASTPMSYRSSPLIKVEPRANSRDYSRPDSSQSEPSSMVAEDLSQSLALNGGAANFMNQSLTMPSHSAFPSPFATYAFVESLQGLPSYPALNLSMAAGYGLGSAMNGLKPSEGGLSIQYTPTGPITVGANGQNMSAPPRKVKDMVHYEGEGHSPPKKARGRGAAANAREGEFMLDQLGEDARKRRRRAPNETLTAEEIAEYMGASNVPSGRDGGVMFKCKYCSDEIEDLVRYLQHTLTVHNAYICHQCGKSFTTKSSLLRHRPIHTGLRRFACGICKKSFYRKDKCKSHIKRHLGPNDQNIDQYQTIEPVPELGEGLVMQ